MQEVGGGQLRCPTCGAMNSPGAMDCARCGTTVRKVRPTTARHLELQIPGGGVIRINDGDVVGRESIGARDLDHFGGVSRKHARFCMKDGRWFVADLGSRNGTYLDGTKIPPQKFMHLPDGAMLRLSSHLELTVRDVRPRQSEADGTACLDDPNRRTLVIMFVDLKGSVDYFQEMGTIIARNWILHFYNLLGEIVEGHGGRRLKNIGDAILAVFDDPILACRAAVVMQRNLVEHNTRVKENERYNLRVGINMGKVIYEDGDVFGNAVNIASRVQALAPPGRIYITENLYGLARVDEALRMEFVGNSALKGVKDAVGIYEVLS